MLIETLIRKLIDWFIKNLCDLAGLSLSDWSKALFVLFLCHRQK